MVINQHIYRSKLKLFEMVYFINNNALKIITRLHGPLARNHEKNIFQAVTMALSMSILLSTNLKCNCISNNLKNWVK